MLKSLELFGFKSFADRTLFEFSPGITCVVGPNGSGKSNVVDAIKWILGDQSAKSLRGKEMADVIFNGSAGRRGSGFAEATLTFDNSNGLLGLDTREVQIGRRLYQSGDSEYLLNRSAVRLKDIKDLFMGTGAGTAAYSIIEQGRVDQILQSNPTTRRLVFEEAAGISKFKSRRVDAERRLERVAQNLLRLTDIVDEVEAQLTSTRSQASKAARYREVSAELESLWTGLAADDCRHYCALLEKNHSEVEQLEEQQASLQSQIEQLHVQKQDIDSRIAQLDQEVIRRERTIATSREAIASHDSTMRHQSSRRKEIEAELRRQRTQRASLARRIEFARGELSETEQRLSTFQTQFDASHRELTSREAQIHELRTLADERRQEISKLRNEQATLQQRRSQCTERLVALQSRMEALQQSREQAQARLEHAEAAVQAAHAERLARQRALTESEHHHLQAQERVSELQSKQRGLRTQREETEREFNRLRERRSGAEARLAVLEEIEQRQEGIVLGVRDILQRAETSRYPPWNRVLGLVRDLIDVPLDLAPIIEAALGDRAQLVAVADLAPMLEYLNRGPAPIEGRVGFVSLNPSSERTSGSDSLRTNQTQPSTILPETQSDETFDLTGTDGVYGRADRLVVESERAQGLAARVLADTWIVETLDVARRLANEAPQHVRFVTLQGEVLGTDDQLFVGTVPHESSIVSRKSELRTLKNEIRRLNKNIESSAERQVILSDSIEAQSDELQAAQDALNLCATSVTECTAELNSQIKEAERLEAEYQSQISLVRDLDEQATVLAQDTIDCQQQITDAEESTRQLLEHIRTEEQQLSEVDALLQETLNSIKTEQLELAKHEERLSGLKQTQIRLREDQAQRVEHLAELHSQMRSIQESLRRCDLDVLNAESQIAIVMYSMESIVEESRKLQLERDQLQRQSSELVKQVGELERQQRKLSDRQRNIEFETQKLEHQLTTLEQRISEEFQTSLQKLVESGVSAYQMFLTERYGDADPPPSPADSEDEEAVSEDSQPSINQSRPTFEDVREELEGRIDRLRRKIKTMGNVNTDALENLEELEDRFQTLSHQLNDLQQAKAALEDIIRRINGESERIFLQVFETIRGHFQELFRKLFGGGDADIILEDPDDVLECGIDIVARPPGKELRSISLLSGGEKTMTAVAMLFAMFKSKPSPYCVLDEVDAALDEANVDRYVAVLKEFVQMTQFVVITHRKRTMTAANVLYGVTMEQAGVSKRMSVRFEDVSDNGEIRTAA